MRKARPFRDIFEECLELVLVKGETVEECLRRYPEHARELKSLLETATAIKKATAVQPSPEFRERARQQFYAALRQMPAQKKRAGFSWGGQPRWATVVAVVLAILLVSSGTVAAASGSMPDQPLYPVKLASEQARLALTFSPLHKAELYARLADRRVLEIVYLASKNKPEQVQRVTQALDGHLARIADLAATHQVTMFGAERAAAPTTNVLAETPTTLGKTALPSLTVEVPAVPQDDVARNAFDQRARLRAMVIRRAADNLDRLKAALDASPQARLALLRAIAVSETGYEKALMSLEDQQ
jgi:hypothetical protein